MAYLPTVLQPLASVLPTHWQLSSFRLRHLPRCAPWWEWAAALVLVCLLSGWAPAWAAATPTITVSGSAPMTLAGLVEVFEDTSGAMTIDDVLSPRVSGGFSTGWRGRGFGSGGYWLRLRLHNPEAQPIVRWLDTGNRMLSRVDLHLLPANGPASTVSTGSFHRYGERPVSATTFVLPVNLPPNQTTELYLRLQSTDSAPVIVAPKLWEPQQLQQRIDDERFEWAVYAGLCAGLFVVNVLVFLQLRDLNYLLYSLALASGLWAISSMAGGYGAAYERLWPDAPGVERAAWLLSGPVFATFVPTFLVHLTRLPHQRMTGAAPIVFFWVLYVGAIAFQFIGGVA